MNQYGQQRSNQRGSSATIRVPVMQLNSPASPSPQDLEVPGPVTTPDRGHDAHCDNTVDLENGGNHKYMLLGARRLYALACEALINEIPELYGDCTEDPQGFALAKAKKALEDCKMRFLTTEDSLRYHDAVPAKDKTRNTEKKRLGRRSSI
ncbi:hypothetical protein BJX64DRAFT_286730 [Aspergillus heterothallicus]